MAGLAVLYRLQRGVCCICRSHNCGKLQPDGSNKHPYQTFKLFLQESFAYLIIFNRFFHHCTLNKSINAQSSQKTLKPPFSHLLQHTERCIEVISSRL